MEPAAPAEPEVKPAEKPATDPIEDLFGDLPKKPAEEPAEKAKTEPAKSDPIEDLFGDLPKAEPAKPAAEPKAEPAKDAVEDLFGTPPAKAAPADPFGATSPRELPMRQWVDNTGNYKIQARLAVVMDGQVQLLKDTGRTSTVPMRRLSDADQQYVQRIVSQFANSDVVQLAAR